MARIRHYQLWTYDVWGNAEDGYEVNDRRKHGTIDIKCKNEVFNANTPQEFTTYCPTDLQLSRAVGCRGLSWDGESDYTLYATREKDGKPEGELEFLGWIKEGKLVEKWED